MDIEEERKAFEEWVKEIAPQTQWELNKKTDDGYENRSMDWAWYSWQASANREGFVLIKNDPKTIVAIEQMVEQQVEASGITQDVFRLDGERILEAMLSAQEQSNESN